MASELRRIEVRGLPITLIFRDEGHCCLLAVHFES